MMRLWGSHVPVRQAALYAGPLLATVIILCGGWMDPVNPSVSRMAAMVVWMAIWWLTETVPLAITALLPIAMFPLLGVLDGAAVAGAYTNSVIMLFLGGFIIALAMQRWGLHRRMALVMIRCFGVTPGRLMLGFMAATAFLSMWISNTAAAMMMVPIALSIIVALEKDKDQIQDSIEREAENVQIDSFGKGLLLAIAYAASIGGMATIIGTPANMVMVQIYRIQFPDAMSISFARWFLMALPLTLVLLTSTWLFLMRYFCPRENLVRIDCDVLEKECESLGPMRFEEKAVLWIFVVTVVLWLTRTNLDLGVFTFQGWGQWIHADVVNSLGVRQNGWVDEGTVAIFMALLLFVLPSREAKSGRLMTWNDLSQFPWSIFLLFGGGFALAGGVEASGLSAWLAGNMKALAFWPPLLLLLGVTIFLKVLSEFTSNTASIQIVMPVLAAMAVSSQMHPLMLMIPAALSASCPFMLPVATPPNAIVFGTERLKVVEMARPGFFLNVLSIALITVGAYTLLKFLLGL